MSCFACCGDEDSEYQTPGLNTQDTIQQGLMHTALLINHPRVLHLFVFVIIRYRLWFRSWELMRARSRTWAICCTSAMPLQFQKVSRIFLMSGHHLKQEDNIGR